MPLAKDEMHWRTSRLRWLSQQRQGLHIPRAQEGGSSTSDIKSSESLETVIQFNLPWCWICYPWNARGPVSAFFVHILERIAKQHERAAPIFSYCLYGTVENGIWANLEHPTIFKIQALALVVQYHIVTGNFQRGFLLFSLTAPSATALRLTYERTDLSPLAQEIRRRLMWSLVTMDGHFAVGLPECELCPYDTVHLRLPRLEEVFNADHISDTDPRASLDLDGVRELDNSTQPTLRIDMIVDEFVNALQQIPSQRYSTAELQRYSRSRWVSRYLAVHVAWHQCHCDAYRLFLAGYKESAPATIIASVPENYVANAVASCLQHARAIISILHDASTLNPRFQVACIGLAICSYHASRLLLFISRSSQNPPHTGIAVSDSLEQTNSSLGIMRQLYSTSAIPQLLIKELEGVIQSVITGQEQGSGDSSDLDEETGQRQPRYARVAKRRQALGSHSILRRARFLDDSAHAAQRSIGPNQDHVASWAGVSQQPPSQTPGSLGLQWQQSVGEPATSGAPSTGYELVPNPGETMTVLPQGMFDNTFFGPDFWAFWQQDEMGMDDPALQTDGNYF
ncbi:hypothetical protein CEP54_010137 [Fusarium duplospermum]|uniref:Transcription factor domain-containing protein n=1 Tax=Fusarium duplospermum TaxID=1325734 RepID=A0A428PLQ6_9HYPO|nr:hypothetical protein CEP54_010137 [Fusarium duplospermum]